MWGIIAAGAALAFSFLPATFVFSRANRAYLTFMSIPFFVLLLYYLASMIYFRAKYSLVSSGFGDLIRAGIYGRVAHPTCIMLAIIGWAIFIYMPDWRVLFSNLWATLVVFFWIKLEKYTFLEHPKSSAGPDSMA